MALEQALNPWTCKWCHQHCRMLLPACCITGAGCYTSKGLKWNIKQTSNFKTWNFKYHSRQTQQRQPWRRCRAEKSSAHQDVDWKEMDFRPLGKHIPTIKPTLWHGVCFSRKLIHACLLKMLTRTCIRIWKCKLGLSSCSCVSWEDRGATEVLQQFTLYHYNA